MATKIDDAVAKVAGMEPAAALEAAVAIWRADRHPLLADLVDALAARCAPAAIAGRTKTAYQAAWIAMAKQADARSIGALAAGLMKSLPIRETSYLVAERDRKRYKAYLDRIAALAGCEHDPRVASALCELLEKAPLAVDDAERLYGPAIALLVEIGDERSIARLRGLVERPVAKRLGTRECFAKTLPEAVRAIERSLGRRGRFDRAVVEKLIGPRAAARPAKTVDVDELIADCRAHPDDDGPREVLADALMEREDPRGEFIQLQLRDARGELDDAGRAQMARVLRKHEKAWIGDVARTTKLRIWRRGFLDELELLQGASADAATWKRVAADPWLATVRLIHKGSASEDLYKTFVLSAATPMLEYAEATTALLGEIGQRGKPIRHVELSKGLTRDALAMLDDVAAKAKITCLTFPTDDSPDELVERIAAWPARARFEELCAVPKYRAEGWDRSTRWWLAFDRLAPVRRLATGRLRDRTVVERTAKGISVEIRATQEWAICHLLGARGLPKVERLVVRGTPDAWFKPTAAFARAIKKLPATAVALHDGWRAYAPKR